MIQIVCLQGVDASSPGKDIPITGIEDVIGVLLASSFIRATPLWDAVSWK